MEPKMIMLSAMYENGGNVTHRHLDGHPELFVYPFESMVGNRLVTDEFASLFPFKYRWPDFPLTNTAVGDFELFFDEEMKTRVRRPDGSKFRNVDLQIDENDRRNLFVQYMEGKERTRRNIMTAFFYASFTSWKNLKKTGQEKFYVGYCPIIGVDGEKILTDFPDGYVIHVVRSPLACYAETKRRPYPLSLQRYVWTWNYVQYRALIFKEKYPDRFLIVRYEDILAKKEETMKDLASKLGIGFNESMLYPSFNGTKLDDVYPWGTIDFPDEDEQAKRKSEVTAEEQAEIRLISKFFLPTFGY